jgi:hypothetical protein
LNRPKIFRPLSFAFDDYLELVDTLCRAVHPTKRGSIHEQIPAILSRLGIDAKTLIEHAAYFLKECDSAVGTPSSLVALAASRQNRYMRGISTARAVFDGRGAGVAD